MVDTSLEAWEEREQKRRADVDTIWKKMQDWPDWKKQVYNAEFAVSAHSEKLPIGKKSSATQD